MSLNRVTLIGNLGSEPTVRAANEGVVCSFRLATNEFYTSQAGRTEHTEWHSICTFGNLAQNCSKYLKCGSRVFVEGRLRASTFRDKEGKQQTRTRIYANTVQFLDSKAHTGSNIPFLEAMETDTDTPQGDLA